jgi:choline-sulfatase
MASAAEDEKPAPTASEPPAVVPAKRSLHLLLSFVIAGWLYGALEGATLQTTERRPLLLLLAATLASVAALGLGALAWLVRLGLRRAPAYSRLEQRLTAAPPAAADDAERASRIQLIAGAASALLLVAVGSIAALVVLKVLFGLQELELARQLAVVMVAGLLIAAVVTAPLLSRAMERLVARLARKRAVSLPPWAFVLLFVTLPLFLGFYPVIARYAALLGPAREAITAFMLSALAVQIALIASALPSRATRPLNVVVALLALAGLVFVALTPAKRAGMLLTAEKTSAASVGARLARAVTDVDRDGASSLFGGRDCAAFDKSRGPSSAEIPGNGIDEDCNGADTAAGWNEHGSYQLFSDALSGKQVKSYNILWIVMETVRADHVPALGYDKPTMPYFGKLAKESLLFSRAYSQATATHLSLPSMLSGIDPGVASWNTEKLFPQLPDSPPSLAQRLKAKGYRTGLVVDNYTKANFTGMQRGFDTLLRCEPDNKTQNNRPRRNLITTANAAEFLGVPSNDPFFLVAYYPDQHAPYTRHRDVDSSKFGKDDIGNYDTELLFMDQQLHAVTELIRARPSLWNNTIIVITADHGEEFEEHGQTQHAKTCFNEVVHVPLLVRVPGVPAKVVDSRVALIDIVPTLLELTGTREDTEGLTGQSLLLPALKPEAVDKNRPIFCNAASVTDKHGIFFKRSVRTDELTLIEDVNSGVYSLFNSKNDIGEQTDLVSDPSRKEDLERLKAIIQANMTGNLKDHTQMR